MAGSQIQAVRFSPDYTTIRNLHLLVVTFMSFEYQLIWSFCFDICFMFSKYATGGIFSPYIRKKLPSVTIDTKCKLLFHFNLAVHLFDLRPYRNSPVVG